MVDYVTGEPMNLYDRKWFLLPGETVPIQEQCDFGDSNNLASPNVYKNPCDDRCQVSDTSRWTCTYSQSTNSGFRNWPNGREYTEASCEYHCGNQIVENESQGFDARFVEECELGGWAFQSYDNSGWVGDGSYDSVVDPDDTEVQDWLDNKSDPVQNTLLVLGCDMDCKIRREGDSDSSDPTNVVKFVCPSSWDVTDGSGATVDYQCTDRCGDGIMDGVVENGGVTLRGYQQSTAISDVIAITGV